VLRYYYCALPAGVKAPFPPAFFKTEKITYSEYYKEIFLSREGKAKGVMGLFEACCVRVDLHLHLLSALRNSQQRAVLQSGKLALSGLWILDWDLGWHLQLSNEMPCRLSIQRSLRLKKLKFHFL
jgi:hypothetical protein